MHRHSETDRNWVFAVLVAAFAPINHFSADIQQSVSRKCSSELLGQLFSVSCLPWIYMLLLGVLSQRVSWYLIPQFVQQARTVLGLYVAGTFVGCAVGGLLSRQLDTDSPCAGHGGGGADTGVLSPWNFRR